MKAKRFLLFAVSALLTLGLFACGGCNKNNTGTGDEPGLGPEPVNPIYSVVINQIYGKGFEGGRETDNTAGSHSFVELYNTGEKEANLEGFSLQAGANGLDTEGGEPWSLWNSVLPLSGAIPAKHSFLVVVTGPMEAAGSNLNLEIGEHDLEWQESAFHDENYIGFSHKNLKVCLIKGTELLIAENPFDIDGNGKKAEGYVDMIGVSGNDSVIAVDGFEGEDTLFEQSKQKAARRKFFCDNDDNYGDIRMIDYRKDYISATGLERYRPRSLKDGAWQNFDDRLPNHLIINQIYGKGLTEDNATSVSNSFIEIYNPTDNTVNLSGYSLQAATGANALNSGVDGKTWIKLNLTGSIPARHSFLVLLTDFTNTNARLKLVQSDMQWGGAGLGNKDLKVVLMNGTALLTVVNPFNIDGNGTKAEGYVDMIGAPGNDNGRPPIDGCETESITLASEGQSKQKSIRRKNFSDTDVNKDDIETLDYRAPTQGMTDAQVSRYRPRSLADGAWGVNII